MVMLEKIGSWRREEESCPKAQPQIQTGNLFVVSFFLLILVQKIPVVVDEEKLDTVPP